VPCFVFLSFFFRTNLQHGPTFGGQVTDIQVGIAEETDLIVGNCTDCHVDGLTHHDGAEGVEQCLVCHVDTFESDGELIGFSSMAHSRMITSPWYTGALGDCSVCHIDNSNDQFTSDAGTVCTSCHIKVPFFPTDHDDTVPLYSESGMGCNTMNCHAFGGMGVFTTIDETHANLESKYTGGTLTALATSTAPVLDGTVDNIWNDATSITTLMGLELKVMYDTENIYMLAQWTDGHNLFTGYSDPGESVDKNQWSFDGESWGKSGNEDRLGILWAATDNLEANCAKMCHTDGLMKTYDGNVDVWHWKAARSNPIGLTDDKWWNPGGRGSDSKTVGAYADNKNTAGDAPEYSGPITDDHFIIIPEGGSSGDLETAINEANSYPGYILNENAEGSRWDVQSIGTFDEGTGMWTVEFQRALNTGHSDDVAFTDNSATYFTTATFDNTGGSHASQGMDVGQYTLLLGDAPEEEVSYVGNETCLLCHTDKSGWSTSMHANGLTVPTGGHSMENLYGVVADADGNGIDDFVDGLDLGTTEAFAEFGANAPVLGYSAENDQYTITIGELTLPVMLTYGGSGLYKQRFIVKIPTIDGVISEGHYVSPVQYNEKTDEYVAYHAEAWFDDSGLPLFNTNSTTADVASSGRSFEKRCVGCHFTGTEVSQTASGEWIADAPDASPADIGITTYDIDGDGTQDLINTSCERCHGPGGDHLGDPEGIISPSGDLTAEQATDLCGFCHADGKSVPNETLSFAFNDVEGDMHDWSVGDLWSDYFSDHGGYYNDGLVEGETRTSNHHHQQYIDFHESEKPGHSLRCYNCHDIHNDVKHHMRTEIDRDGVLIATDNDNNTLCLACHAGEEYFEALTPEMIADYENNLDVIGAVVSEHTNHPYDPESGPSRCSKCHNPKVIKSAVHYDIHSHTFEAIPPYKTLDYAMPNACAASCHRGIENGPEPIFNTGTDLALTDWSETSDIALAEALMGYYGPGGSWWNTGSCVAGDLTTDGSVDVLDIVRLVDVILGDEPTEDDWCGDVNNDGGLDVLDVVAIVDIILGVSSREISDPLTNASISFSNGVASISKNGSLAGIQLEVSGDFTIDASSVKEGWEIHNSNNTIIIFSTDGSELGTMKLFEFDGILNFSSGIATDWTVERIDVSYSGVPMSYSLAPAYPNPFNPNTTIRFGIPYDSDVRIIVYDILGREITQLVNQNMNAGIHNITWNASTQSSGLYMIKMISNDFTSIQKVLLMK